MERTDFEETIGVITRRVGEHLREEALKLFDKMTAEEKVVCNNGWNESRNSFYLAKLIAVSLVDTIKPQFGAESMERLYRKIDKIRTNRP